MAFQAWVNSMVLRIILSLSMTLPALPVEAAFEECPFTSMEECREWLEACCGAGELAEAMCGSVWEEEDDDAGSCASECGSFSCCFAEADECGGAVCSAGSTCSNDPIACNETSDSGVSPEEPVCLWCVCCPPGRPRPPEQRPASVTQRQESERQKLSGDTDNRRIESPTAPPAFAPLDEEDRHIPPDSRQALLCVWRN